MYSASVVDSDTTSCFLDYHDAASFPKRNTKSEVLFLSSMSPAKSLSVYATTLVLSSFLQYIPSSVVPFKYLSIRLAANQCVFVGLAINLDLLIRLTSYVKSGLVAVKYIKLPTTCLNCVASTLVLASFIDSFVPGTIGFFTAFQSCIPNRFKTSWAYFL